MRSIIILTLALSGCTTIKATAPDSVKPAVEAGDALVGAACVAYDATATEYPDSWAKIMAAACAVQRNTFIRDTSVDLACVYVGPEFFTPAVSDDMRAAYGKVCGDV